MSRPDGAVAAPRASAAARAYVPLAVLFSLLWASAFDAIKIGLHSSPPLLLMSARFLLAAGILLAVALAGRRPLPAAPRHWLRLGVLGVLNYGAYLGIAGLALDRMSAGLAAILASTNPLLLVLIARLLLGERVGRLRLAGMVVAFVSVVTIMWARVDSRLDTPLGVVLLATANCFLATGTALFKRWNPGEHLTVVNGVQLLVAGTLLLALGLSLEPVRAVRPDLGLALSLGYLVVAVSVGAMSIWFFLLRSGDAARASSYFFLNPVFGLLLGALLLSEPLRPLDLVGTAGVAVGLHLVQRGEARRDPRAGGPRSHGP